MKFRVTCEILETHEQVIEAPDADHAEDALREEALQDYVGGWRKVESCHAEPVEEEAGGCGSTISGGSRER